MYTKIEIELPFGWFGTVVLFLCFQVSSLQSTNICQGHKDFSCSSNFNSLTNEKMSSVVDDEKLIYEDDLLLHEDKFYLTNNAFAFAIISTCLVGFSGIVPLLILPSFKHSELKEQGNSRKLKRLLSFAVGSLLGDVFLHLLPESWEHLKKSSNDGEISHWATALNGLWILTGLISFCLLEKVIPDQMEDTNKDKEEAEHSYSSYTKLNGLDDLNTNENNNNELPNKLLNGDKPYVSNGHISIKKSEKKKTPSRIKKSGYLNLLANCIDNFTHGLAVGGSYMVSARMGMLTTLAILLHEIPHEVKVGDFAILLRAGFTRFEAVKLQLLTACGGIIGAITAFLVESVQSAGDQVLWILPFTSGGFIYVALCTLVPDILQETSPRESLIQLFYLLLAILVMYAVSFIE